MRVEIKDLHLAAYMKANGAELVECSRGKFVFETTLAENEWRVTHSNSCCRRVDMELINLRQFLKR